jgi:methyl-accepting chemotaxis protein
MAIRAISATIRKMSEIAGQLTSRVEERDVTTQKITRNVQEAADGTAQVLATITDVSRSAIDTEVASSQVLGSAQSLARESNRLKLTLDEFLIQVSAA